MGKKAIFFDIDGTIYLYGNPIPTDTIDAITRARKNGHLVFICTGRTKSMIYPEILDIGFDGVIAGAGTYAEVDGKILYGEKLEEKKAKDIITNMRKYGIMSIPEGIEAIYFDINMMPEDYRSIYNIYCEKVGENVRLLENDLEKQNINVSKVSGEVLPECRLDEFRKLYEEDYNIVMHGPKFIEMIPGDYSKAKGIEKVIEILGIDQKDTYAFGDGMNDYEMLKFVKYGVAMGNATEEFKRNFKYVTDDFDKGGIYNAMEKFDLI